ncbi:MAG: retron St85 family RNA-directed DNA polymerase [Kiritimatiellia bacterium]
MKTENPYELVAKLGLLQRQAHVDPEIKDLICAYARLKADRGEDVVFYGPEADASAKPPSFLVRWLVEKNPGMDARLVQFLQSYSQTMAARRLPVVFNSDHLARKMRIGHGLLCRMAFNAPDFYSRFEIPKSNGSPRAIAAPQPPLLRVQNWILAKILSKVSPHRYATAFIPGRSILDNARPHAGRSIVIRMDLKDFFPSIAYRDVRRVFEKMGYPYRAAAFLANLCTLDGCLPQGAPTSPAISNLVALSMDKRFAGLRKKLKFRYSRYADDLAFSSQDPRLPQLIPFFKQIIREEGYVVNDDKTRIMRQGYRQSLTGLVLNVKPNLPRRQARLLRAMAHRMATQGVKAVEIPHAANRESDPENVLRGHLSFYKMVSPPKGTQLMALAYGDTRLV